MTKLKDELVKVIETTKLGIGHHFSNSTDYDLFIKDWRIKKEEINLLAQSIIDHLSKEYVKKGEIRLDEEKIRLKLIANIGWFIQEWEDRPKSGKGSDRSDLMRKLAHALALKGGDLVKEV
jgi:hypothetical protein